LESLPVFALVVFSASLPAWFWLLISVLAFFFFFFLEARLLLPQEKSSKANDKSRPAQNIDFCFTLEN
jgi:Kef-type K+ transport system membrane component KefB